MKREKNLYAKIYDLANLLLADKRASKGKKAQFGVIEHRKNKYQNLLDLQRRLKNKVYKTSTYYNFIICEPKERQISRLPYFPDRICHHAILNIIAPILIKSFTTDTYSCIPNRGIHLASFKLREALQNWGGGRRNLCSQV